MNNMKNFKMIFTSVFFLIFTNIVIAENLNSVAKNQRALANPDVNIEVRSREDIVKDSSVFTSINPGDNAMEMSSNSKRNKNKIVTTQVAGIVQLKSNNKNVVKKYNSSSNKQGKKKIK